MTIVEKATPGRVSWVDLQTSDPERARAFYAEVLGWTFEVGDDANTGFYTMALCGGRKVAGMAKLREGSPYPPMWSVYFASESVDDLASKVSASGGKVLLPPMDVMDLGRLSYFSDPSGAYFGSWQAKKHHGAALIDEPGSMCWHEIYSRDVAASRTFFTGVLGLEEKKIDAPGIDYWTLHLPNDTKAVCGAMQLTPEMKDQPSRFNTYFAVTDVDASVAKVLQTGGRVVAPAFDTPYGRIAFLSDPLGADFCIMTPTTLPGS